MYRTADAKFDTRNELAITWTASPPGDVAVHKGATQFAAERTPRISPTRTEYRGRARAMLQDLRKALAEQRDLREVFLALFPKGLT
jgi:hypothetical protein